MLGRGVRENGMEGARLRGHAKSLPSGVGNAGAESRGGDAVVAIDVRESVPFDLRVVAWDLGSGETAVISPSTTLNFQQ